jgi:flagellar basal-body rod protein FlgG
VLRSLQTARHSLHREQTRIDNLANNLANVATSGFRQILTRITEQEAPGVDRAEPQEPAAPPATRVEQALPLRGAETGWVAERQLVMSQAVDMRPGSVAATGRNLDVALSGRGFFVVRDEDGNEYFTRDGGFNVDAAGRLVNAGGMPVQGAGGAIQIGGGEVTIDAAGDVMAGGTNRGRLRVVDFPAPERLLHRGGGLLAAPPDMPPNEAADAQTAVLQGHLESSNVDPVRTLVDMIAAQRAFEIGTKVLQANDEMLGQSVNTLGRNA